MKVENDCVGKLKFADNLNGGMGKPIPYMGAEKVLIGVVENGADAYFLFVFRGKGVILVSENERRCGGCDCHYDRIECFNCIPK